MTTPNNDKPENTASSDDKSSASNFHFNYNVNTGQQSDPECTIKPWEGKAGAVAGRHFNSAQLAAAEDALTRKRFLLLFVPVAFAELFDGFIESLIRSSSHGSEACRAYFESEELAKFHGDFVLRVHTLRKTLSGRSSNRCIIINIKEMAPFDEGLFRDIVRVMHPAPLNLQTEELSNSNTRLIFVADTLSYDPGVHIDSACAIDVLFAAKQEILSSYSAADLNSASFEAYLASGALGPDNVKIAAYLHRLHTTNTLLKELGPLLSSASKFDPRAEWKDKLRDRLRSRVDDPYAIVDPMRVRHNDASIEVARIITFIFSIFDSLTYREFESLFETIVALRPTKERVNVDHLPQADESGADQSPPRIHVRTINASIIDEFRRAADEIFKSLSIRENIETKRYSFVLPNMKEDASEVLFDEFPITPRIWFSHITVETPTIFTSTEHVAQQLADSYALWLSRTGAESARHFSELNWWGLAAKIVQDGFERATKDIKDETLLQVVQFLSKQIATHQIATEATWLPFVARVCMLYRCLLSYPQLEPLVEQELNGLIVAQAWRIVVGVCKTLQFHRKFDALHWIFQLTDRGDDETRDTAAILLSRQIQTIQREQADARALFQRLRKHLTEKNKEERLSSIWVYSCLPRLVFSGSVRLRQKNYEPGPYIAPFFMLDKTISQTGLVGEIEEVVSLLMQVSSKQVVDFEAAASAEAAVEIWSAVKEMSEAVKERFKQRFREFSRASERRCTAKGASLSLLLIEAFEQLRAAGKRHWENRFEVEKALVALIGQNVSEMSNRADAVDIKRGMALGAAAAALTLAPRAEWRSRYETAERIERWAKK